MWRCFIGTIFLGIVVISSSTVQAQMSADQPWDSNSHETAQSVGWFNVLSPTMGGKQVWTDEFLFLDWRIQRNSITGHHRLLDGRNFRHAWGDFDECMTKLQLIKKEKNLRLTKTKAVIVLHGLFRNRSSVDKLADYVEQEGDYLVFTYGYASTRADIERHAKGLANVMANLEGITEINLVAHSLGNLVIRRYMAMSIANQQLDPRIRRIVMVGAPNNGAHLARVLSKIPMFDSVAGEVGDQLGHGWEDLAPNLCVPQGEFGIIAGGRNNERGYNPLIPGDDDMVVAVEETRLPGARDFKVLPVLHSFMMSDEKVMEYTLRFLQHGHFVSEAQREPIPSLQ